MDTLLRLVGYLSVPLVVLSVWVIVRGLGTEYRLRIRDLSVTVLFSVAVLVLFVVVLDVDTPGWAWGLAIAGFLAGALVGRATAVRAIDGEMLARRSAWACGAWLVGFAYAQLAVLGALPGGSEAGLGAMFLATGIAVGTSVSMGLRRSQVIAAASAAGKPASEATAACAHCGRRNLVAARFCGECGWHLIQQEAQDSVLT